MIIKTCHIALSYNLCIAHHLISRRQWLQIIGQGAAGIQHILKLIKCVVPSLFWHWIRLTLDPGDIDIDLNTGWQRPRSIQYGRRHSRLLLASDLISMHTRDLMQLCCWRWINDVLAFMFNLMLDWTLFSWETVCSETSGLNPQSHVCINSVIYRVCMLQQLLTYIMIKLLMYIMVTSQQWPRLQTIICKS